MAKKLYEIAYTQQESRYCLIEAENPEEAEKIFKTGAARIDDEFVGASDAEIDTIEEVKRA